MQICFQCKQTGNKRLSNYFQTKPKWAIWKLATLPVRVATFGLMNNAVWQCIGHWCTHDDMWGQSSCLQCGSYWSSPWTTKSKPVGGWCCYCNTDMEVSGWASVLALTEAMVKGARIKCAMKHDTGRTRKESQYPKSTRDDGRKWISYTGCALFAE